MFTFETRMDKIELNIVGISRTGMEITSRMLVLETADQQYRIPIIVGDVEAQAIAMGLEHIATPRPLTHDLFVLFAQKLHLSLSYVYIYKYDDRIFYAKLVCKDAHDAVFEVESRTSDAIALAVRLNSPIYTNSEVLDNAGLNVRDDEEQCEEPLPEEFEDERRYDYIFDTMEELQVKIAKAIEDEDFETASVIRDEIRSRKTDDR